MSACENCKHWHIHDDMHATCDAKETEVDTPKECCLFVQPKMPDSYSLPKPLCIKFAHDFTKLWGQTKARLLDVKCVTKAEIDEDALDYDTEYFEDDLTQRFYPIDDGNYLRLVFIGNKGIPFTTYRTDTPEHWGKYLWHIGEWFEIKVNKEDK